MLKTLGVESSGRSSGNVKKSGFYPKWKARETLLPAWSPSDIDTRKKDLRKTHPSLNTPEVSGEVGRRCCLPFTGRWVSVGQADRRCCPWPCRQPAEKPAVASAARAAPGLRARLSLEHPKSTLSPSHHRKVVQIGWLILKRPPEVLRKELFMTKYNNRSLVLALQQ